MYIIIYYLEIIYFQYTLFIQLQVLLDMRSCAFIVCILSIQLITFLNYTMNKEIACSNLNSLYAHVKLLKYHTHTHTQNEHYYKSIVIYLCACSCDSNALFSSIKTEKYFEILH